MALIYSRDLEKVNLLFTDKLLVLGNEEVAQAVAGQVEREGEGKDGQAGPPVSGDVYQGTLANSAKSGMASSVPRQARLDAPDALHHMWRKSPICRILPAFRGRGLTWTAGAAPGQRVGFRRGAKLTGVPIVGRRPKSKFLSPGFCALNAQKPNW